MASRDLPVRVHHSQTTPATGPGPSRTCARSMTRDRDTEMVGYRHIQLALAVPSLLCSSLARQRSLLAEMVLLPPTENSTEAALKQPSRTDLAQGAHRRGEWTARL